MSLLRGMWSRGGCRMGSRSGRPGNALLLAGMPGLELLGLLLVLMLHICLRLGIGILLFKSRVIAILLLRQLLALLGLPRLQLGLLARVRLLLSAR